MLAASGAALLLANNQSVSVSYDTAFTSLGQGDLLSFMRPEWVDAEDAGIAAKILGFVLSFPTPAWIAIAAFLAGGAVLNHTAFGRHVLAVGGGTEASRLMGLPVNRTIFLVYVISGGMAGLAGVILAAQFGAGQPIEGIGWELFAIASVVVGGTLLTGGRGSIAGTLAGALLLGLIYTILNFENGMGWISLSAYWQSVVRGIF
jgi:ribose transport system permease protein